MKKGVVLLLFFSLVLFSCFIIAAENSEGPLSEWRMFGRWLNHTNYDGVSFTIPSSIAQNGIVGSAGSSVFSAPAIVNGYVYYTGGQDDFIYQVNASNVSQVIASYDTGNTILSSPIVVGGYMYVGSAANRVYQLNASNVSQLINSYTAGGSLRSSPAIANGSLYIGSDDDKVYQLNASNVSQLINSYTTGGDVESPPAIANGYVYVGSDDDKVYQLNASNVSQKISNYTTGGDILGSPTVYSSFVYIASRDAKVYQLNSSNISHLIASYTTGAQIVYSSVAISNGFAYVGSDDDKVYQLNASNVSQLINSYTTGADIRGSPTVANGFVYVGALATDSKMYQLNASNVSLFVGSYTTGGDVFSTPAYAQGFLYFGSYDGNFYQLNASNLSKVEFVAPNITINSPANITYTASVLPINISSSEQGVCNYSLGGTVYTLSNSSSGLEFTGNNSFTTGQYNITVQCFDLQGNMNGSVGLMFSVVIPSESSSGGEGGNGGGTSSPKLIDDLSFEQGVTIELSVPERAIFNVLGEEHTLTLNFFNATSAKVTIASNPLVAWLTLNNEEVIDLNEDGLGDMIIKYNGINNYKASLFLKKITSEESGGEGQSTLESPSEELGDVGNEGNYVWIVIIIAVLLVISIHYGVLRRTNQVPEEPKDI